jgi:hypothetical protein
MQALPSRASASWIPRTVQASKGHSVTMRASRRPHEDHPKYHIKDHQKNWHTGASVDRIDRDRSHHRRSHAERDRELRRAVLPGEPRRRPETRHRFGPVDRRQRRSQPCRPRLQFPDRIGSHAAGHSRRAAGRHRRQGTVQSLAGSAPTTRPRPCRSAIRFRSRPAPRRC